jgi:hypothetical protein
VPGEARRGEDGLAQVMSTLIAKREKAAAPQALIHINMAASGGSSLRSRAPLTAPFPDVAATKRQPRRGDTCTGR